jgi:hypothetical protein
MIADGFPMRDSPVSPSVLSYSEEVPSVRTVPSFNSPLEIRRLERSSAVEQSKAIEHFEQQPTLGSLPRL